MSEQIVRLEQAFAALDRGDLGPFEALFAPGGQWLGVPGGGFEGETPIWRDRREVVDLLRGHHCSGRRFRLTDFVEEGPRVAVGLAVTDPSWEGVGQVYKVFTFRESDGHAVLLEDCKDRSDALEKLGA